MLCFRFTGNRVVAAPGERVAPDYPPHHKHECFRQRLCLENLRSVIGTRRIEPARRRHQDPDCPLVNQHQLYQDLSNLPVYVP